MGFLLKDADIIQCNNSCRVITIATNDNTLICHRTNGVNRRMKKTPRAIMIRGVSNIGNRLRVI